MKKFNAGKFLKNFYVKHVKFSKAVLWKDKQISLNTLVTRRFKEMGVDTVVFIDDDKNEKWVATVDQLREVQVLKQVGQEKQLYFPIEVFTVSQWKPVAVIEPPHVEAASAPEPVDDKQQPLI